MGFTGTGDLDRFGSTSIAAVFGGMASQATGGDFYEGAMRGAFVHLYNHLGRVLFEMVVGPEMAGDMKDLENSKNTKKLQKWVAVEEADNKTKIIEVDPKTNTPFKNKLKIEMRTVPDSEREWIKQLTDAERTKTIPATRKGGRSGKWGSAFDFFEKLIGVFF